MNSILVFGFYQKEFNRSDWFDEKDNNNNKETSDWFKMCSQIR